MEAQSMPSRATALLDAAIELAGAQGLRAVTHRAVDDAAGLPRGTAIHHFSTKAALIEAMIKRQLEIEHHRSQQLARRLLQALAGSDQDLRIADIVAEIVRRVDTDPRFALAHYELMLADSRNATLQTHLAAAADDLWSLLSRVASAAGSADPSVTPASS